MSKTTLPRLQDPAINRVIDQAEQAVRALENQPLAGVQILPPTFIGTGDTRIFHGLGRALSGFWIVMTQGDVRVALSGSLETLDPQNYAVFRANVGATVTLAVF